MDECSVQNVATAIIEVTEPKLLGTELGLTPAQLDEIESYPIREHKLRLVEAWFRLESNPTWEKLVAALKSPLVQKDEIAEAIGQRYIPRRDSLTSSSVDSGVISLPLSSLSLSSASSTFSSLTSSAIKHGDEKVNIILQRNTIALKHHFSQFVMKVRKYLTENSASTDFEQFKHFLEIHYKEIPDLNLEDIEGVFQFFINNGYWDYLNLDFLSEAISTFTDTALKRAEREYRDRVSAYMATVKIAEFISENNKLNQHLASKQTPSTARKRSESQYLEILSIKLNVNIGSRTLNYIEDLWKKLSFLNLPKIGVVLDCIVEKFVAQGQPLPFDSIEEEPEEQFYEDQQLKAQRRKIVSEKLLGACRSKMPDITEIRGYLEQEECDVSIREDDEFRWSPLMWACENHHFEIGRLLLKYQPQVNIQDKKEWSPLVLASRAGDLEIVQGIEELGAEINKPTNKLWTPLMWAAQEGHARVAEFLLQRGAFVDFPDENGWTPLMQASQEGHVDVVNVLLDHGAKANHQTDTTWFSLMAAAKNKHSEVVDALLRRGAEVDLAKDDGSTTLQVASYYKGNSAVVNVLIKHGANVDHRNIDGMTPLMMATNKGHLDTVQALIDGGADINIQHPETGWPVIFFAAKSGNMTIFKELLHKGAKTEIEGTNVAEVASMFKRKLIVSELQKFEQASHRQISSHVPTLEPSPLTVVEPEIPTHEPKVDTPPTDTPTQQSDQVPLDTTSPKEETSGSTTAGSEVKPVATIVAEPVTTEVPEQVQQEPVTVSIESSKKDIEEVTPQDLYPEVTTSDEVVGDSDQSALPTSTETPTKTEPSVSEKETEIKAADEPSQTEEEQKHSQISTKTTIKEPEEHSEAKKTPKMGIKQKAEIIDLLMKGFGSRLANPKSNRYQGDTNEAGSSLHHKGPQSAGVITHSSAKLTSAPSHAQRMKAAKLLMPRCTDLRGVEVAGRTSVIVTDSAQSFYWSGYGFKLYIPPCSLPADVDQCELHITASLAGQYKLPDKRELVSGVFWVQPVPPCRFNPQLTVEIQHSAKITSYTNLTFVRAVCSQESLPYTFKKLEGRGSFSAQSSYGSLELDHFSGVGVVGEDVERLYTASIYYLGSELHSREIHFVVNCDTEIHQTSVDRYYSGRGAILGPNLEVEFEEDRVSLDIPMDGVSVKGGWMITPLVTPSVSKKQVDNFKPGRRIPSCQLRAEISTKYRESIPTLFHRVKLQGAKDPCNEINIILDTKSAVSSRSPSRDTGLTQSLSIDNLYEVYSELLNASSEWFNLGLALKIHHSVLINLFQKLHNDNNNCLREMLARWLTTSSAPCTWNHLCKCLRKKIVGCCDVAMEIERNRIPSEDSLRPRPAPTGEKRRREEGSTEHTEEEQVPPKGPRLEEL